MTGTASTPGRVPSPADHGLLGRHGRSADSLTDVSAARPRPFVPFIGQGLGQGPADAGVGPREEKRAAFKIGDVHGPLS